MSAIKTEEEAAVRAVAESSNTRTWNVPDRHHRAIGTISHHSVSSLDNFVPLRANGVTGSTSPSIVTPGQVVDKQLEVVNE